MTFQKPIRLYWHENYSDKTPFIRELIQKAVNRSIDTINLYPGNIYAKAAELVAKSFDVKNKQIIFGHGIEGLINLTVQSLVDQKMTIGYFYPSFFGYYNNAHRHKFLKIPCRYDQKTDVHKFIKDIQSTDLFFLASPNTGTCNYLFDKEEIETVLKNYKGILVVDECFYGIGNQTVIELIYKYKNLVIYRGLTKAYGLASLRLGYAISSEAIINKLHFSQNDLEYDPINTFSLNIFIELFPYFEEITLESRKFFTDFYEFLVKSFPHDTVIHTQTTAEILSLKNYVAPKYKILNFLIDHGYIIEEHKLVDNTSIPFPEILRLPAPPKEYWNDYVNTLKMALHQKK